MSTGRIARMCVVLTVLGWTGWAAGQAAPGGTDPHEGPQGIAPVDSPIAISVDQGSVGLANPASTWDVNDLVKNTPGLVPSGYIFMSDSTGGPPAGSNVAIATPWQLGLLGNFHPMLTITNADNLDAASLGKDYFSGGGALVTPNESPNDTPYFARQGSPGVEPIVLAGNPIQLQFSVNRVASGVPGSAVNTNKLTRTTPAGSVYATNWPVAFGTNAELYSPSTLGLTDQDDLDALENYIGVADGQVPKPQEPFETFLEGAPFIFFSVDRDSRGLIVPAVGAPIGIPSAVNVQASLGNAAGDIFVAVQVLGAPLATNLLLISEMQLGLSPVGVLGLEDDLDALALNLLISDEDLAGRILQALPNLQQGTGPGVTIPLLNPNEAKVLFSVKEGSIGLMNTAVDWEQRINPSEESGDIFFSNLTGQNWLSFEATTLGLLESDELNALDTSVIPEPATMLLVGTGLLGLWGARRRRG